MTLRSSAVRLMLLLAAVVPVALAKMPAPSHSAAPEAVARDPIVAAPAPTDEPCSCSVAYTPTDDAPSTPCVSAEKSASVEDKVCVDRLVIDSCFIAFQNRYPILGWVWLYRDELNEICDSTVFDTIQQMVFWVAESDADRAAKAELVRELVRINDEAISTEPDAKPSGSHCPVASMGVEPATCARLVLEQFCPTLALVHSCPYVGKQAAEFARPCLDCTVSAGQQFLTDCLAHAATTDAHEASEEAVDPPTPETAPEEETTAPPVCPEPSHNCRLQILDIFANEKEAQLAPEADAAPKEATAKEECPPEECEPLDVMPSVVADDKEDACPVCPHCPASQECPASGMEMTCPYINKQKAAETCPQSEEAAAIPDVLENLENLTKARDLMDQCDKALAAKDYAKAKECCEWVAQHCAGSRWAAQACKCELEMHQAQAATEVGVELCYPQDCDTAHEKLKTARHMMKKGDHYRLKGQFEKAARYYRKVETLCPESKIARRAAAELQLLAAMKTELDKEVEEAEPPMNLAPPTKDEAVPQADDDANSKVDSLLPPSAALRSSARCAGEEVIAVEQRCAEAVEAGQRALADGKLDEAEQAAQFALGLDCDCVAAQALMKLVRDHRDHACELGCHSDPGAASESEPATEPSEEAEPPAPAAADDVVDWEMLLDSTKPENAPKDNAREALKSLEERCEEFVTAGKQALEEGKLDEAELAAKTALCLDCESVAAQELLKQVRDEQKKACDEGCHTDRGVAPASAPESSEESEPPTSESGLKHRLPPVDPQLIDGLEGIEEQSPEKQQAPTDDKDAEVAPILEMPYPMQDGPQANQAGYGRDTAALLEMVTPRIIINAEEERVETTESPR